MKRILGGLMAAIAITVLMVAPVAAAYPTGSDANHASNWNNQFPHPAQCFKHEAGDDSAHGYYSEDGKTFTLNVFNPDWPGDHWEAIIVKAGSEQSVENPNLVTVHPTAGVAYAAPEGKGISHVIVCKGTEPEVTPSPTPSTTPSATPSITPTPTPTPTSTPTFTPTPTPSASSTPTPSINPQCPVEPCNPEPTPTPTPPASPTFTPEPSTSPPSFIPTPPPTDTETSSSSTGSDTGILGLILIVLAGIAGWTLMGRRMKTR